MSIPLYSVAGTRDFYPDDMILREWLFDKWKQTAVQYGYKQYDAPILEHTILYTRKGGDDITKEMYSFEVGEDSPTSVCLRPEMTPSCCRMIMKIIKTTPLPIKWFSIPQCWRYETTTRGRKREHYQWNVDNFGGPIIKAEAEILALIVRFFKSIGLTYEDVVIKISNRMILQTVLKKYNITDDVQIKIIFNIIDKLDKLDKSVIIRMLFGAGLIIGAIEDIFRVLAINDIIELGEYFGADNPVYAEMCNMFVLFEAYGITNWIKLDLSVVRGLSYYTGIVFEGFFRNTEVQRSIFGGGRYDNLLKTYGYSTRVPAVGFGMGNVVIMDGLQELGKLPKLSNNVEYCIIPFNKQLYPKAANISEKILDAGKTMSIYMTLGKVRIAKAYAYADNIGAQYAILIAPREIRLNKIRVKNMRSGSADVSKEIDIDVDEYLASL